MLVNRLVLNYGSDGKLAVTCERSDMREREAPTGGISSFYGVAVKHYERVSEANDLDVIYGTLREYRYELHGKIADLTKLLQEVDMLLDTPCEMLRRIDFIGDYPVVDLDVPENATPFDPNQCQCLNKDGGFLNQCDECPR